MAVNLSPVGGVAAQFFTNTGAVLTGGKLYTYAAGTTTPVAAYTSSVGNTPWSNPIVLDAAGRVSGSGEIWLTDGVIYKFVLKDSNDVLIATYDNITGINSNAVAYTNQQEIVTATAGQTVFNLGINYQPGTNSLSVFVDGVNQYGPGAQYSYVETDSNTVTFNAGLHVGAEVKFTTTQQQAAGAVDAAQVSYDPPFTGSVPTNVEAKLAQTVSVKDFGAVGDGVTDDTAAIQAAFNSGAIEIVFGGGESYYCASEITIASNSNLQKISGPAILLIDHAGPDYPNSTYGIKADKPVVMCDITMLAQNTDYSTSITDAAGTTYTLNTREFCIGFGGKEGTTLDNCRFENFYTAVRIDGSYDSTLRTVVQNCATIECGGGSSGEMPNMNFYSCNDLLIDKHYAYVGDEIVLPSNKRVVFSNSVIFLPNKPSIDFGGSGSSGYECELINVCNNIVYGRDPIVCEFGAWNINISDNICVVTMTQPDGIGIGVTSGGTQGLRDVSITGNIIRLIGDALGEGTLATPIASGITVRNTGTVAVPGSTSKRILIANNSINTSAQFGIDVTTDYTSSNYGDSVRIIGNAIQRAARGIRTQRFNNQFISNNDITFATTGVLVSFGSDFTVKDNRTIEVDPVGVHYYFDTPSGTNNKCFIQDSNAPEFQDAFFVTGTTTDAALIYVESVVGGTRGTPRVKRASKIDNPTPTSGGYVGVVCTAGTTTSTTWSDYGLIS